VLDPNRSRALLSHAAQTASRSMAERWEKSVMTDAKPR
jgi:hypothetical protein